MIINEALLNEITEKAKASRSQRDSGILLKL